MRIARTTITAESAGILLCIGTTSCSRFRSDGVQPLCGLGPVAGLQQVVERIGLQVGGQQPREALRWKMDQLEEKRGLGGKPQALQVERRSPERNRERVGDRLARWLRACGKHPCLRIEAPI